MAVTSASPTSQSPLPGGIGLGVNEVQPSPTRQMQHAAGEGSAQVSGGVATTTGRQGVSNRADLLSMAEFCSMFVPG